MVSTRSQTLANRKRLAQPYLPPEIWSLIASKRTLYALIRVCNDFHDIFSPHLNSDRFIPLHFLHPESLAERELPPGLAHVKKFDVQVFEFCSAQIVYENFMGDEYTAFLTRLLEAMPKLESFSWKDMTFEDDYAPNLMLQNTDFTNSLQACKNLKDISLHFASQYMDPGDQTTRCWCSLKGFQNLTSLTLLNFYGNFVTLAAELADVLGNCPALKHLALGLACDCYCDSLPEAVVLEEESESFLKDLCIAYAARNERRPLALDTLRLGWGLCLYHPFPYDYIDMDNESVFFLHKLVDVSSLRSLELFNGLVKIGDQLAETDMMYIDWNLLKQCPSLRRLTITALTWDARDWLLKVAPSVQELVITSHSYRAFRDEYIKLLPQLSMIYAMNEKILPGGSLLGEAPSDLDSSDLDSTDDEQENKELLLEATAFIHCLNAASRHLKKLSFALDFDKDFEIFLSKLVELTNLTQLRLHTKTTYFKNEGCIFECPAHACRLWPELRKMKKAKRSKEAASRYVKLLHVNCSSLQYVKIYNWAWQIIAQPDGAIQIYEMDFDEMRTVEIFAWDELNPCNGLLAFDEPCRDYGEKESKKVLW